MKPRSYRYGIINKGYTNGTVFPVACKKHSVGFNSAEFCGFKVCNNNNFLSDEFIGGIMLCNSGNDLASAHSVIELDFIKFFCFRNFFTFKNFCYAKFNFSKIINRCE